MMKRNAFLLSAVLLCASLGIALVSCELTTPKPEQGTMRVLSIGIDYLNSNIDSLRGTVGDAYATAEACKLMADGSLNRTLTEENIILMTQKGRDRSQATIDSALYPSKKNILAQLELLATTKNVASNDFTIIYYSGHGVNPNGTLATATVDSDNGKSLDASNKLLPECALTAKEFLEAVQKIPGKKLLIFDSCHSGNYISDDTSTIDTQNNWNAWNEAFELLFKGLSTSQKDDLFVISAAKSTESSYEPGNGKHGNFTQGLLSGLGVGNVYEYPSTSIDYFGKNEYIIGSCYRYTQQPPASNDKTLTLDELFSYAKKQTPSSIIDPQHPQIIRGLYDLVLFTF